MSPEDRDELEIAFIRQFSVHGVILGGSMQRIERAERIRVAIMKDKLAPEPMPSHPHLCYAEGFKRCYGHDVELRRAYRAPPEPQPMVLPPQDLEDDFE